MVMLEPRTEPAKLIHDSISPNLISLGAKLTANPEIINVIRVKERIRTIVNAKIVSIN